MTRKAAAAYDKEKLLSGYKDKYVVTNNNIIFFSITIIENF